MVSDGASPNLTMIKELTGAERKAFGYVLLLECTCTSYWQIILYFLHYVGSVGKAIVETSWKSEHGS